MPHARPQVGQGTEAFLAMRAPLSGRAHAAEGQRREADMLDAAPVHDGAGARARRDRASSCAVAPNSRSQARAAARRSRRVASARSAQGRSGRRGPKTSSVIRGALSGAVARVMARCRPGPSAASGISAAPAARRSSRAACAAFSTASLGQRDAGGAAGRGEGVHAMADQQHRVRGHAGLPGIERLADQDLARRLRDVRAPAAPPPRISRRAPA